MAERGKVLASKPEVNPGTLKVEGGRRSLQAVL